MGGAADIVKASAAIGVGALILRYLWRRISAKDQGGVKRLNSGLKSPSGSPKAGSGGAEEGVWVYFGSQTGTAEGFSKELEEDAPSHDLRATVVDMEDFDPEEFVRHKAVVIIVATYGEGDPTDNSVEFFKWIQDESLPSDTLKGMSYTVMGCGNRQYVNFNQCAKDADKHMQRLGATCIHERGEGDDDQNIEEDWEQWKDGGLWPALQKALGGKVTEEESHVDALESPEAALKKLQLKAEVRETVKELPIDPLVQVGGADVLGKWYFGAFLAPVSRCEEIRQVSDPSTGKTTKHIDIDIKQHPSLDWKTADNLEVLPRNPLDVVEWFAEWLGVSNQLDSNLTFVRAEGVDKAVKKPFPTPCTVRTALELYCDLAFTPSKANAKRLCALATEQGDREALEGLLQDREALHWLTGEGVRLSFREFVELFMPTAKVDLGAFLQLCPRQKSRPYTIASSSLEDRKTIGICVSMVKEQLASLSDVVQGLESRGHRAPHAAACMDRAGAEAAGRPRTFEGACSTMLCTDVSVKSELWIYARASTFRLPKLASKPIVMIGAGTGIAPFRAFVREFRAESRANAAKARSNTFLYFGCTKRDVDFLYKDELEEALTLERPALKELITAFSREQKDKVYVQHRLRERKEEVAQLVADGACIYVCGAVSMGRAIRDELAAALGSADRVSRLVTEGRFIEELW